METSKQGSAVGCPKQDPLTSSQDTDDADISTSDLQARIARLEAEVGKLRDVEDENTGLRKMLWQQSRKTGNTASSSEVQVFDSSNDRAVSRESNPLSAGLPGALPGGLRDSASADKSTESPPEISAASSPRSAHEVSESSQSQDGTKTENQKDDEAIREATQELMAQDLPFGSELSMLSEKRIRRNSLMKIQEHPKASKTIQVAAFFIAICGVVFVLLAKGLELGKDPDAGHGSSSSSSAACAGSHRRLGAGPPPLLEMVAYCLLGGGIITFFVNMLRQPLILGYLLGGVLVGPQCLDIVHSVSDIQDFSSLGLVFLLFMVGLELDVKELFQMGRVVLITGFMQFPVCVSIHLVLFMAFNTMGVSFGEGDKAVFYCAMTCGISSTMIVVKMLSQMADMNSGCGKLTVGILIFQDMWAITVLAMQPDLANPQATKLLRTFGMVVLLMAVAWAYAKFIMPVVFQSVSGNVELMLVISLCWCFFLCCFAVLPFIGLSMELAALVAGVALAAYPYSAELNGKIKYIRDFFITVFFCSLGMQIPLPSFEPIFTAFLIAIVVLLVRWIGIFSLVLLLGGGPRLAVVATINLSEVSEFALVICSLGLNYSHIETDTLTIIIWVFAMLAIMSANVLPYSYKIYGLLARVSRRARKGSKETAAEESGEDAEDEPDHGSIVILGFHKVAAMLTQTMQRDFPEIIQQIHVVDFNEALLKNLQEKGFNTTYGDISCADVLEHAVHGEVRLVILSIPDYLLRGTSNEKLTKVARQVWPECKIIANADNPDDVEKLYNIGADYVLRMSNLCADKLSSLISEFTKKGEHAIFTSSRQKDVKKCRRKESVISFQ